MKKYIEKNKIFKEFTMCFLAVILFLMPLDVKAAISGPYRESEVNSMVSNTVSTALGSWCDGTEISNIISYAKSTYITTQERMGSILYYIDTASLESYLLNSYIKPRASSLIKQKWDEKESGRMSSFFIPSMLGALHLSTSSNKKAISDRIDLLWEEILEVAPPLPTGSGGGVGASTRRGANNSMSRVNGSSSSEGGSSGTSSSRVQVTVYVDSGIEDIGALHFGQTQEIMEYRIKYEASHGSNYREGDFLDWMVDEGTDMDGKITYFPDCVIFSDPDASMDYFSTAWLYFVLAVLGMLLTESHVRVIESDILAYRTTKKALYKFV